MYPEVTKELPNDFLIGKFWENLRKYHKNKKQRPLEIEKIRNKNHGLWMPREEYMFL